METPNKLIQPQFDDTVSLSAIMRRLVEVIKLQASRGGASLDDQQAVTYGLMLALFLETGSDAQEAIKVARTVAVSDPGYIDDYLNRKGL